MDQFFDQVLKAGLPEDQRMYMGMVGFKVRINVHGEIIDIEQPGMEGPDDE